MTKIASDNWNRPYTREAAAFPATSLHDYKFWQHMGRVDNVFARPQPGLFVRGDGELSELNRRDAESKVVHQAHKQNHLATRVHNGEQERAIHNHLKRLWRVFLK